MKFSKVLKRSIRRSFLPGRLFKAIRIHKKRKHISREINDPQLEFYSEVLTGDFLHLGYFKDVNKQPEDVSFNDIETAQLDYAMLFVEQVKDKDAAILDVGCGMGGLSNILEKENCSPFALTPDVKQIKYIKNKYPKIPIIEGRFEDIKLEENKDKYGTVITSESLQYLDVDKTLDAIDIILKSNGRWLICDYLDVDKSVSGAYHNWNDLFEKTKEKGWEITHKQDITPNITVTLKYLEMFANRIGRPLLKLVFKKFEIKQPGLHFLMKDVVENINTSVEKEMEVVNPKLFNERKKYLFLVIERKV